MTKVLTLRSVDLALQKNGRRGISKQQWIFSIRQFSLAHLLTWYAIMGNCVLKVGCVEYSVTSSKVQVK